MFSESACHHVCGQSGKIAALGDLLIQDTTRGSHKMSVERIVAKAVARSLAAIQDSYPIGDDIASLSSVSPIQYVVACCGSEGDWEV